MTGQRQLRWPARRLFERGPARHSETFLLVEFSNVMATCVRQRPLSEHQGLALLEDAERVFEGRLFAASHLVRLRMAGSRGVSAQDARFSSSQPKRRERSSQ